MTIDFPPEEHEALKKQFETYGFAYTTRVSTEVDKYEVGHILETPWGRRVRVSEIIKCNSIDDHPYCDELNEKQKEEIASYGPYHYIKLDYV